MPTRQLSRRALSRATLARQMLLAREKQGVLPAVKHLFGLQAQVARPPFVALWSRLSGFERTHLKQALRQKKVVRATAMRATLHLLSSEDYLAFRSSLQPALDGALLRNRLSGVELAGWLTTARSFFEAEPQTFEDFRSYVAKRSPKADSRAIAYAVRCRLPLVQIPTDDQWAFPSVASFTTAQAWLGQRAERNEPDRRNFVLRYLAAFGPATVQDVQAFSGLRLLKADLEALRDELQSFRDPQGRELFDLPSAPRPDEEADAPIRFLPEFDSLLLAHADRTRVIADPHRAVVLTSNLRLLSTFLVDGFVAGTWTLQRKKSLATLEVRPFATLSKHARAALGKEGEQLARFAEEEATAAEVRFAKPSC